MNAASMIVDHRNIGAAFRRISLPIAVQMLGDQLLGIVDTIVIGAIGTAQLADVTAAQTLFMTLIMFSGGMLSGLSILAAQRIGAHDVDGFGRTARAGAVMPLLLGVVIFFASLLFAPWAMASLVGRLGGTHGGTVYLILRCASLIPIAISGSAIVSLGAAGNRRLGVIVLAVINIVHIPLLLVLALGWLTHHPLGIVGAGISTLISETIAACYAIVYIARRPMYGIFSSLSIDLRLALETARLGWPESVFGIAVVAPDILIIALLAPLGATAVAAFRALTIVSDLTFVVPNPLQAAVRIVIGQRLGARDVAGARWFLTRARRVSTWLSTAIGALVAAAAWPLAWLCTLNPVVASAAAAPLALHMLTLPIKSYAMVSMAPIRAAGDTRFSMFVGLLCSALVFPIAWFSIEYLHIGLFGVPIAWIAAWSARALFTEYKLRGEDWTTRRLIAA